MCFTHKNFAQVLYEYQYSFHTGDIIAGTIFSKETEGYLVDIGAANVAYLPFQEICLTSNWPDELSMNRTIEFFILAYNTESKQLILSLRRLRYIRAWDRIKQLKIEDIIVQALVKGINKGGLLIETEHIQGFIPNSQLSYNINKNQALNKYIPCKFLIADEQNNQLIMSNRCARLEQIIDKIAIGSKLKAPVADIKSFGIFFNIYDIPALLHKSEISKNYTYNLDRYFSVGTLWEITIIHVDPIQGRVSVSLRK